ncbi:flagellar biosynthesis protein FliZ [Brevibacillus sp. SYP-B805]|uniref:flagellar biosynthetic protein FliO n=1 Tax=Brevibacillus sp. SYP-B805 TaxID=1578199 RepID=UPI0013EB3EA9|nr:flagellar biosynthetic protein FliO [Brevibacillus sp. SYP-B805]NGQ94019.1 flagellar biosynthesis protein FliZ [Brevibacillus sp. SYP-B805]
MSTFKAGAKLVRICLGFLLLAGLFPACVHANEPSAWDALHNQSPAQQTDGGTAATTNNAAALGGEEPPSGWTLLLQVFFSLGLVIILIYLLLRFLANRKMGLQENGPMRIVSSLPVGNGKTIQMVMIGDSLYILGVGDTIQLIRHIPPGDELDLLLAEAEIKSTPGILPSWLPFLRGNRQEESMAAAIRQANPDDTFADLLERQWDEVNRESSVRPEQWNSDGKRGGQP